MKSNKNSKIILIIIILLVVIILFTGLSIAYFATDIFKSNKELFFKYIYQMGDNEKGFLETQLTQYFEKKKSTPYTDEGNISVNITASNGQQQYKNANQMNLTFNGKVDEANNQAMQDISLNYSDDVKFPLTYKQIQNSIGLQTKYIGNKFIVIDTSKEELLNNIPNVDKLEDFNNISLTEEELNNIINTYKNVIEQNLQDNNFSQVEDSGAKGYRLTLKQEELKKLIISILETLKNDTTTLDKINEYIKIYRNSSKITTNYIDEQIQQINENSQIDDEQTIELTVYKSNQKTNRFQLKINQIEINLEKTITGNDIQYNIRINYDGSEMISFVAKYAGLQSMQSISENYELKLNMEDTNYQYNYFTNVDFAESVDIEAFSEDNAMFLSEAKPAAKNNFITALVERIQQVNKKQMEELGLEENENPLQDIIPKNDGIITYSPENTFDEEEISMFNNKFENYESTNLAGATVKGLLTTIQLTNQSEEDNDNKKISEIHFDGDEYEATEQNITLIKSSIETETHYRVEFERDETTGRIYRAVINKK